MSEALITTDHDEIRAWVESRGGNPAKVRGAGDGILRVDFDPPDESLQHISWEEFFQIFDDADLAFLHQDMRHQGGTSRFNKFIDRRAV